MQRLLFQSWTYINLNLVPYSVINKDMVDVFQNLLQGDVFWPEVDGW